MPVGVNLTKIFTNFDRFILRIFNDDDNPKGAIEVAKRFFYTKFIPLAKYLLDEKTFKFEAKLIEERFRFLESFIVNDKKWLILNEYGKMLSSPNIRIQGFYAQSFYFLVRHVATNEGERVIAKFSWLYSQSPTFILYFLHFFGNWSLQNSFGVTDINIVPHGNLSMIIKKSLDNLKVANGVIIFLNFIICVHQSEESAELVGLSYNAISVSQEDWDYLSKLVILTQKKINKLIT